MTLIKVIITFVKYAKVLLLRLIYSCGLSQNSLSSNHSGGVHQPFNGLGMSVFMF